MDNALRNVSNGTLTTEPTPTDSFGLFDPSTNSKTPSKFVPTPNQKLLDFPPDLIEHAEATTIVLSAFDSGDDEKFFDASKMPIDSDELFDHVDEELQSFESSLLTGLNEIVENKTLSSEEMAVNTLVNKMKLSLKTKTLETMNSMPEDEFRQYMVQAFEKSNVKLNASDIDVDAFKQCTAEVIQGSKQDCSFLAKTVRNKRGAVTLVIPAVVFQLSFLLLCGVIVIPRLISAFRAMNFRRKRSTTTNFELRIKLRDAIRTGEMAAIRKSIQAQSNDLNWKQRQVLENLSDDEIRKKAESQLDSMNDREVYNLVMRAMAQMGRRHRRVPPLLVAGGIFVARVVIILVVSSLVGFAVGYYLTKGMAYGAGGEFSLG